jgi:hypothetical protein
VVLGGAADSASAPVKSNARGAHCKDAARPRSDTHPAPRPRPLLADHERVSAAPRNACPPRGPRRRALRWIPGLDEPPGLGHGHEGGWGGCR